MVTLKDISELTGVSISTVSRALKGSSRISDATKKLVQEAANELMFKKGIVSQAVRPVSRNIGILFPAFGEYYHDDPTSSSDLRGLRNIFELSGHSVTMIPFEFDNEGSFQKLKTLLDGQKIEGLIISDPPYYSKIPDSLNEIKIPFIVVNGIYRAAGLKQMDFDNYSGMKNLAEYLIDSGAEDFAVFTGPENRNVNKNRLDGLMDAFEDHGIKPVCIYPGEFSMDSGYERGVKLLQEHPAVKTLICFSDYIALGAMKAVKEDGKRIPEDIRVSGFDDVSFSQFSDPPLTTVKRHSEQFAPLVMSNLINFIEKGADVESCTILFKAEIIRRNSA